MPALYLFGILSALLKTSQSFSYGNISINSFIYFMNLYPYGNISAYSYFIIDVTDLSPFTMYTSVVDIRDCASVSPSGSFVSDSSDIRKPLCTS